MTEKNKLYIHIHLNWKNWKKLTKINRMRWVLAVPEIFEVMFLFWKRDEDVLEKFVIWNCIWGEDLGEFEGNRRRDCIKEREKEKCLFYFFNKLYKSVGPYNSKVTEILLIKGNNWNGS